MRIVLFAIAALLASCSSTPLSPHKIDIQQGNYVTQEMVSKLKPGMTKSQVRFLLGTPLITDTFHVNRWDYFYRLEKRGDVMEQRKLTVIFEEDKLVQVAGDVVPASAQPAPAKAAESKPAIQGEKPAEAAEKPGAEPATTQPKPEKGFFGRMLEKLGL
ncbi:MAG: outer membrane protein assembly factor BamE [Betaproteobacteria bacterium]|nr:outer membrane protein assembly factor BamE [Betaproteobacteria bacterium]